MRLAGVSHTLTGAPLGRMSNISVSDSLYTPVDTNVSAVWRMSWKERTMPRE